MTETSPAASATLATFLPGGTGNEPVVYKSFSASPVQAGTQVTLTITILAPGLGLNNVLMNDTLSGLKVATPQSISKSAGCGGGAVFSPPVGSTTLTMSGGTIAAGGSCVLTVKVIESTATAGMQINTINAGDVTANVNGTNAPVSNLAPVSASVTYQANIAGSKSFVTTPINAAGITTVQITLNKTSTAGVTIDGVGFTDDDCSGLFQTFNRCSGIWCNKAFENL